MTTGAISGLGTKLYRDSSANSSSQHDWVAIAEVLSISGPTFTKGQIDVTSLDSTGGYREFIGGFRDAGQITLKCNFTRAGYTSLKADYDADVTNDYKIVLPPVSTGQEPAFLFSAFCNELPLDIPLDSAITCSVTLKISGEVTFGDDSSSDFL